MSIGNPQNDFEQGLSDAVNEVLIDPLVKKAARDLELSCIAEQLARAIGHTPDCHYSVMAGKCECGASKEQAAALDRWQQFKALLVERQTHYA